MGKSHRYITSLLLTTVYLLIVAGPVAPLAMQSKSVAHALTGKCSGDCMIDGCSLDRSASHTCCCWQKKRREASASHDPSQSDMRVTPPPVSAEVPAKRSGCCPADVQDTDKNEVDAEAVSSVSPQKKRTATISSHPCGNGKLLALLNTETAQHLPFFFADEPPYQEQALLTFCTPGRLTSRFGDPPDPPPIIS